MVVKLPQRLLQRGNIAAESGAAADMKAMQRVKSAEHLPLRGFAAGFNIGAQQAVFGVDDLDLLGDRLSRQLRSGEHIAQPRQPIRQMGGAHLKEKRGLRGLGGGV